MYGHVCPYCGARLDPCERCDCEIKEKAAHGVATTEDGKAKYDIAIIALYGGKNK